MAEIWGYDVDQLIAMPRHEMGLVILRRFKEGAAFHPKNESLVAKDLATRAGAGYQQVQQLQDAIMSACGWLNNEGYVVDDANSSNGWQRVTRHGAAAATGVVPPTPNSRLLAGFSIDFRLSDATENFQAGRHDAAVMLAMKAIEVAVRTATGLTHADIGDDLMKKAFLPGGILADPRLPDAENTGRRSLFSGAVGWLRNPAGHRQITFGEQEVAEILLFANYLLRVTDEAGAAKLAGWPTT